MTFTTVPILVNFNQKEVIGELKILTEKLPITHDFVLSLGVRILDIEKGAYTLMCVSPIIDTDYAEYLKHKELNEKL